MSELASLWAVAVDWLRDQAVIPAIDALHLEGLSGDPRDIASALLIAALQVGIIGFILRPLETLFPAERWADRRLTLVDRNYTLLMLLGIFPVFTYLVLMPFSQIFGGSDTSSTGSALALTHWMPWFDAHPYALFAVYYVIYDFVYYWIHRTQHALPWWWALHSMHHSQRQMSCWTNDRGSLVDGFIQSMILATVGLVIGVDPDQFAWLMLMGELVQNFSHTNVRIGFGPVFQRVLVAPKFHRLHHMLLDPARPTLHNCNFGQVFAIWDVLFGTALYGEPLRPTGVSDPMVDRDNDYGLVGLHWVALKRFWATVWCLDGWKLGEVSFDEHYRPHHVDHVAELAAGHAAPISAAQEPPRATRTAAAGPTVA